MPTIREEQFLNFNSDVILAPLTGFTSGAGTVASTDTLLQGFQKLDGNDSLRVLKTTTIAGFALSSNVTLANLTASAGIAGGSYNGSTAVNWTLDTSNANTWAALQTFGTNISIGGVTAGGATGIGSVVFSASPTLTGTPLTVTGTAGDTSTQIASNAFVNANSTSGEPNYFYPGSLFKQTRVNIALNSALSTQGSTQAPIHIALIGDSRMGIDPNYIIDAVAQYGKLNSIGFIAPYSNIYGSAVTWSQTGTITRNDNTSAATFGIAGSRLDLTTTQSWSIQPASRYPFDKIRIYYNKTVGGGTFNWSVDGGSTTSINTDPGSGADSLGIVTINTTLNNQNSHTLLIANVSGSSRIYGVEFENQAEGGFVVDVLQSGGSQVSNWTAFPSYTAAYIAAMAPAAAVIWFDVNDAISSVSSSTYMTNIRALVTALALPAESSPMFLTYMPKMTAAGSGVSDTTANALMNQYRSGLLAGVATDGWSVIDTFSAYPSISYMNTNSLYLDDRHFSIAFAPFVWTTMVRGLLSNFTNPDLVGYYPKFQRASNLIAPTSVAGFGLSTMSGAGGLTETNTGWYGKISNSTSVMYYQGAGAELLRMGSNGTTNTTIHVYYPTSTYANIFEAFRQGSTSANAFKLTVNADNSTTLATNNAVLAVTATSLSVTGKLSATSSISGGGTISTTAWGNSGVAFNIAAGTYTDTNSSGTQTQITANSHNAPTFATTNTSVTYTDAYNTLVNGNPISGTNTPTFTNNTVLGVQGTGANQLKLLYDATHNATFSVSSGGLLTIKATSGLALVNPVEKSTLATVNASATLTAAQMQTGWKTTSTTAVALTTATATATATQVGATGSGFDYDFIVDNTSSTSSGTITITLGTGWTAGTAITGGSTLTIAIGVVALFHVVFTSATTAFIGRVI